MGSIIIFLVSTADVKWQKTVFTGEDMTGFLFSLKILQFLMKNSYGGIDVVIYGISAYCLR